MKGFKKPTKKQTLIGLVLALGLVAIGIWAISRPNSKSSSAVYPNQTSDQPATGDQKSSSTGSSSSSSPSTSSTGSSSSSTLSPPQGQASHTIVSKSAEAQAENSPNVEVTCLTSAANDCLLRLTSPTGTVTTINHTYDDKQGNFIFDFSAKTYQVGSWKMELVATRSGQSAATNIGPLEVKP